MNTTYAQRQTPAQKKDAPSASSVLDASSQSESLQRKADMVNSTAQRAEAPRPNNTGMPDNLKAGIESLSGFSMDDVRVHYNSSKPATVQALAYTQGTDIHVAPGQEKHLPHEAWHVAQQMAGRVSPTTNINGMPVNDNAALEHEADVMGEKAVQCKMQEKVLLQRPVSGLTAQCLGVTVKYAGKTQERNFNDLSNLIIFIDYVTKSSNKNKKEYDYIFGTVGFSFFDIITKIRPFIILSLKTYPSIDANNVDISKLSGFTDLDSFKKCIKKCIKKEWHKCNLKSTVNIGTEFTFRGREADWPILPLSGLMSANEKDRKFYKDAITIACPCYKSRIESFANEMKIFALSKGKHVKETIHESKCENIDAHKLSFMSGLKELWWINVDVDDNCIELQTDAINYNEYSENYDFFNNLIFVSAKNARLEAATDKTDDQGKVVQSGGGGHISLDSESAFGRDVGVLHTFIREYTKKALQDVKSNSGIFSYNDGVNSPLLKLNERRLEDDFNNVFLKNSGDIAKYLEGLKGLYRSLKNEQLKELKDAGIVTYDGLSHYQAVNVDHFLGEEDKSRIEMRNFDAQISIEQLLDQVDALFDILADAYIEKEERQRTE